MSKKKNKKETGQTITYTQITNAINCVEREIRRRCLLYPKLIVENKAPEIKLKKELENMQDVLGILKQVYDCNIFPKVQMELFDTKEYEKQETLNYF